MTYTLTPNGDYMYVRRKPTQSECDRYLRNGYTPPALEREHDRTAYQYARGETKPNYPMPAIDYYNSANPSHIPIGNMMELAIPVKIQLQFRG